MQKEWIFTVPDLFGTLRVADSLGRVAQAGDTFLLHGDLGAGKTTFVQGLAAGLDVDRSVRVTSPSFAIIQAYAGRLPIYHVDLYRISHTEELQELGLEDCLFSGQGVTAIEWGDRLDRFQSVDHLAITLDRGTADERNIRAEPSGARGAAVLDDWRSLTERQQLHSLAHLVTE